MSECAVLRLPNELMLDIFRAFIQRHSLDSLTLSHVCKRWRDLTLGIAELWSSIGIHDHGPPDAAGIKHLTTLYLERSASCALDVLLDVPSAQFLQLLSEHSLRWRSLHLLASEEFLAEVFDPESSFSFNSIRGRLPLLEELVMKWVRGYDAESNIYELYAFEVAPKLRKVELGIPYECFVPGCLSLPRRIEHISLTEQVTFREVTDILCSYPQLQNARFEGVLGSIDGIMPSTGSSLSSLTSLSITMTAVDNAEDLFHGLTFPNLTTLELCAGFFTATETTPLPNAFLSDKCTNLRILKLSGFPSISEGQLLDLFRGNPQLETLDLRDEGWPTQPTMLYNLPIDLMHQLTFRDPAETEQPLLPRLRCLLLHVPALRRWERSVPAGWFDSLFLMLASRRRDGIPEGFTRLQTVGFGPKWLSTSYLNGQVPDSIARLEKGLRSEGLVIE